jgi:hypothetical protein
VSNDPLSSDAPPVRKRGGQRDGPSQRAAIKYGFYARKFERAEIEDLAQVKPYDLDAEIEVMRVLVRRVFESAGDLDDFEGLSGLLGSVTLTAMAFARLLHTRMIIQGKPPGMGEALMEAIRQLTEELDAKNRANEEARAAGLPEPYPDPPSTRVPGWKPPGG